MLLMTGLPMGVFPGGHDGFAEAPGRSRTQSAKR
jgi:hypothetical protein